MGKIEILKEKLKTVSGEERVVKLNDLAFAHYNTEPEKTEEYAKQALVLAKKIGSQRGIARSYNIIGVSFHRRSDFGKALSFYSKALKIFEKVGDKNRIATSKHNIGGINEKQGNYDLALKFYYEALNIWEEEKDKEHLSASYNNIGIIYEKQGSYERALEYNLKSLQIKEEIGDKYGASISHNNIGIIYANQGNNNLALEYYLKALTIKEEIGDNRTIAISYINIGNIYSDQDDYEKAMDYFVKALKSFESIDDKYGIATTNTSLGFINTKLKKYDIAHEYLEKSLQLSSEIGAKGLKAGAMDALSGLYEAQSDFEQALLFHKKFTDLTKKIFNEQKSEQIAKMQTKYETEKKEKEAEIFRLKNVELAKANKQLEKEIIDRKKAEKEIKISRKRLQTINTILRHDLINDFAVIKSALHIYKDNSEPKMLDEIAIRVKKGMDTIHRQRKQESFIESHSALSECKVREILNKIIKDYPNLEITISGDGIVYADEAIYSVFENLISNSIKHGNTNKLNIEIDSKGDHCEIKFSDLGIGIPDDIKEKIFDEGFTHGKTGNTGIGLFIVKQTIKEYGGDISVEDNKPNGALFVINLRNVKNKVEF